MVRSRTFAAVVAVTHIGFVLSISAKETLYLIQRGLTIAWVQTTDGPANRKEAGTERSGSRSVACLLGTYLHGFFAPNVPPACRLIIDVTDGQGTVKRGVLAPGGGESDLRRASLLDVLGRRTAGDVRDIMFGLLAKSLFEEQANATTVEVTMERLRRPTLIEFGSGSRERTERIYSYVFSRDSSPAASDES
jgi:hypothetical protein